MKRILSFLLILIFVISLSACGKKNVPSNVDNSTKNSDISMYDYCPNLNNYVEIIKKESIPVLGYEEDKNVAGWYTKEDLSEYVTVGYTSEKIINSVQVNNDYKPLISFLRLLPGAITSKKEIDEKFASTKTTSNEVVNGEVVYTDKYVFSTDGIDYFKIVKRTPSKTLTQTIYVECKDIVINPLDYRDLKPNLLAEEFYKYAQDELKQKNYDSAIYYFECADTYKDSKSLMKECAYNIANSYYEKGEFVKAGTYLKIADDYSGSKELLQKVTEKIYPEAETLLNKYADDGDITSLNQAVEKFEACDETYKEAKKLLEIASTAQYGYSDYLLEDALGKKIAQNHMVVDYLRQGSKWCAFEKTIASGGQYERTSYLEYINNMGDEFLSIGLWGKDGSYGYSIYGDIYTSYEKIDEHSIPEKLSDYSINGGEFSYNDNKKFKIEIVSKDELILQSFFSGKKYTLYREESDKAKEFLKDENQW